MTDSPDVPASSPARRLPRPVAGGLASAAVLAGVLLLPAGSSAASTATAGQDPVGDTVCGTVCDTVCGIARFDRADLPGRPVRAGEDWPTQRAADQLALHGWPRAVPYAVRRWTVVVAGDSAVLVTRAGGATVHLPVVRDRSGDWTVGPACEPRPAR